MEKNNDLEKMRIKNLRYTNTMLGILTTISLTAFVGTVILCPTLEDVEPVVVIAEKIEKNDLEYVDSEITNVDIPVENSYSGMKVSNELEDEVKRLADLYGVPYEIILTIGERESGGKWDNEGIISKSSDYGVFQINECNLNYIEENLGYTKEDLLYNSFKNAEACIFLVKDIINRDDVSTIEQIFGMYNGWVGWENKPISSNYSSGCCEIINEYFPDFTYGEDKKY